MAGKNTPESTELSEKELLKVVIDEIQGLKTTQTSLLADVAVLKAGNPVTQTDQADPHPVSDSRTVTVDQGAASQSCLPPVAQPRADSPGPPLANPSTSNSGNPGPSATNSAASGNDLESQYWTLVKDVKFKDIRLGSGDILKDNHKGFKKEHKPVANILSRSARYVETGLKVLSICELSPEVEDLVVVLRAHLDFLKTEYGCLVVANDNSKEVAQNYRRIKGGTTGMSTADLQDLKLAQEITALSQVTPQERDRGSFRGGRGGHTYQRSRQFRGNDYRGRDRHDQGPYRQLVRSNANDFPNNPHNNDV